MADIPVRVIIDAIDNASKELKSFGGSLDDVGNKMRTVGAAGAAIGGMTVLLAKGFIGQAGAMEQNQVAFETMLGSADKAKTLLTEMQAFAAKTPFDMPSVVEGGKQLLAYGFAQEEVIDTTRMLGDVAAGLNIPIGDIIYLFGTLRAQGRAYTKDLNQFTARGIPILDALAKQYGITKSEVFKFAETGKIGFEDVEKAFQTMTNEGGLFFNLMEKQSKTTLGTWSNLKDSIIRVQITLGNALLPAVNQIMDALMPVIEAFGKWAEKNPGLVKGLVIAGLAIGAIGAVLVTIGLLIPPIIAAVGLLGAVFAVAFSPITLVIAGIIAAIALLYFAWTNNFMGIQQVVQTVFWNVFATFDILYAFFTETLPFAIDFLTTRLSKLFGEDIPAFINSGVQWFSNLRVAVPNLVNQMGQSVTSLISQMVQFAKTLVADMYSSLVQWFSYTFRDTIGAIEGLPGEVARVFNAAKERAVSIIVDTYNTLKGWGEKIVGILRDIVDWAGNAINKAREAVTAGFNAGKRQYGGPVSAASPVIVGEAGPELIVPQVASTVIPNHALKGGGGGNTIQFIINTGMIINSPTERRNLAEALYKDLATLARSQNMTVAELMGA